jgi:hypothetical protein
MIKRMAPPPIYMEDTSVSVGSPPRRNAGDGIDDRLVTRDAGCNRRAIPSAPATGIRFAAPPAPRPSVRIIRPPIARSVRMRKRHTTRWCAGRARPRRRAPTSKVASQIARSRIRKATSTGSSRLSPTMSSSSVVDQRPRVTRRSQTRPLCTPATRNTTASHEVSPNDLRF